MNTNWENAIKHNNVKNVLDLLAKGEDENSLNRYGQTALMLAAHAGHREIVETLIDHRANLNCTSKFGLSALMLAIITKHIDIARLLVTAGADLSLRGTGAPGFNNKTAYDLAWENNLSELYEDLTPKS
ncbi:MAG: ankyrin repeat domain-containing protein [Desulfobulbaceae bacterium]|nr:ankyrin repeat domain-containing protein [Desulfobulbaceae bacterium]